jgi:uncharacterized membrane protein SpoIIM required for sporulation
MIFNGMLLGVFAAIHHEAGIRAEMWAWILPHGITEIGAIILCGGVGFQLGKAIVRPGELSRNESLLRAGREAALTCLGVAGMLLMAAVIESYVRQSHWSTGARLAFAAATAFFWAMYFAHGIYRERQAKWEGQARSSSRGLDEQETFGRNGAGSADPRTTRPANGAGSVDPRTTGVAAAVRAGSAAVIQRID